MRVDVIALWPVVGVFICGAVLAVVIVIEHKRPDTAPPHDVGYTHFHEWGEDDDA